jgi:hypothetical protein
MGTVVVQRRRQLSLLPWRIENPSRHCPTIEQLHDCSLFNDVAHRINKTPRQEVKTSSHPPWQGSHSGNDFRCRLST